MPGLKLTIVASIYGKPYKWVRTLAIPAPTTTTTTIMPSSSPTSPVLVNTNNGERISPVGRRIINPCALSAHDKGRSNLGFGGVYKSYSSIYSPKSFSEDKGGEREPSALATDGDAMGPEHSGNCVQNQHQFQHQQPSKLLTLPTILTLGRVAAVPFLVSTFYVDSWWGTTATTSIFIAAAITDWLDGYIARKMRLGTTFGAFLDPVADKLMVAATLVLLCTRPLDVDMFARVPWLLPVPSIAIIGREITMSAVREWAASQNGKLSEAVAVNNLGKWKTATQMTALTILLATRDSSLAGPGILVGSGIVLLYISAGLAVWSLVVYMRKIWKVLIR